MPKAAPLHAQSEGEAYALLKKAHRRLSRMLKSLRKKRGKSRQEIMKATRFVLADRLCIFATLVETASQKKFNPNCEVLPLVALSNQINMWAKCSEPVHLRKTDSYSEKERFHYSFKLIESTRNALVKKVCEAACETLPTQFASKGGSPEFEAWLIKYLPSAKFVFTTDIPNCFNGILFGSVLNGLPLPGPVLERVLKDTRLRAKPLINGKVGILSEELLLSIKQSVEASSSGRGIPIGAAGSAIAAEIVIKGILQAIAAETHGVRCAAHADNLIFLADDKKAIPSLIKVLHNQVSMHFGTDVTDELARRNTITPADDEFLFCGIHYCSKEGQLIKRLEEKRLYDFAVKIDVGIDEAVSVDDFDKLALRVKGWLRSRQFSLKAIGVGADLMQEIGMRKAQLSSS